jgi:hypothetical protein
MPPLIIDLSHDLDPAEVRRRMNAGVSKLPSHIPGGVAKVSASWPSDDRMAVDVSALGQEIATTLDVRADVVRVTVHLPGLLALAAAPIEAVIRRSGEQLLLAPPKPTAP